MKEIKTCEEYVLMELEEKREQVKRLKEACNSYLESMEEVNAFMEIMRKKLNLHKAADGKEIITMGYIFEEYEPDEFKFLKDLFHLEGKGEEKHE